MEGILDEKDIKEEIKNKWGIQELFPGKYKRKNKKGAKPTTPNDIQITRIGSRSSLSLSDEGLSPAHHKAKKDPRSATLSVSFTSKMGMGSSTRFKGTTSPNTAAADRKAKAQSPTKKDQYAKMKHLVHPGQIQHQEHQQRTRETDHYHEVRQFLDKKVLKSCTNLQSFKQTLEKDRQASIKKA